MKILVTSETEAGQVSKQTCSKVEFFDTFVALLSESGSDIGKVEIADIVSIETLPLDPERRKVLERTGYYEMEFQG